MKHRLEEYTYKEWLELIFNVSTRTIDRYVTTAPIHLDGYIRTKYGHVSATTGFRKVPVGTEVWVRIDTTMPDRVDVEACLGVGKRSHMYTMTMNQYWDIAAHLKLYPLGSKPVC